MKTEKEKYVTPCIEVITLHTEECIAASTFGTGAASDAVTTPGVKSNSFWKSSNPFMKED